MLADIRQTIGLLSRGPVSKGEGSNNFYQMITFKLVTKMFSDSNQNHCHKFITIINKRTLHLDLKKGTRILTASEK